MKKLSLAARQWLETYCLKRDSLGRVLENPEDMFRRLAQRVAAVEGRWASWDEVNYYQNEYFQMMNRLEFLPSAASLKNFRQPEGLLSESFVLTIPDSIAGMAEAVSKLLKLQRLGTRVSLSLAEIRPKDELIQSNGLSAEGPLASLQALDKAAAVRELGSVMNDSSTRHLATMPIDHPDIMDYIGALAEDRYPNFCLMVGISSHFMRCVKKGTTYPLRHPQSDKNTHFVAARSIFEALCQAICQNPHSGIFFSDEINRYHSLARFGKLKSIDPEHFQALLPEETLSSGSINLAALMHHGSFDEERFEIVVDLAVRYLDNLVELNHYPSPRMTETNYNNRKIGLGLMGFAELLMQLEIPYDSKKAREFATYLMKLFSKRVRQASFALAKQRGPFGNYSRSSLAQLKDPPLRNANLISFSGSPILSRLCHTTQGIGAAQIEDYFYPSLEDQDTQASQSFFRKKMEELHLKLQDLAEPLLREGSLQSLTQIPQKYRDLFRSDQDIKLSDQLKLQSIFQKYTDNIVAKVFSLSRTTHWKKVQDLLLGAYHAKFKMLFFGHLPWASKPETKAELSAALEESLRQNYPLPQHNSEVSLGL